MFNGWTVLEMILGGAGGVILVAFLAFIVKCLHDFVKTIKETAADIKEMKEGSASRKKETRMLFKGMLTIFDIMEGKDMNGNVAELQEMYDTHFIDKVN